MGKTRSEGSNLWGMGRVSESEARRMAPLALAYLGDAVYEVYVRDRLLRQPPRPQKALHREAVSRVRASAQAAALREYMQDLTEDEADVVRRGRNARVQVPKGGDSADQHYSTAFEALVGYLYLIGKEERVDDFMKKAFESVGDWGGEDAEPKQQKRQEQQKQQEQ